jgi:hypothetical protein
MGNVNRSWAWRVPSFAVVALASQFAVPGCGGPTGTEPPAAAQTAAAPDEQALAELMFEPGDLVAIAPARGVSGVTSWEYYFNPQRGLVVQGHDTTSAIVVLYAVAFRDTGADSASATIGAAAPEALLDTFDAVRDAMFDDLDAQAAALEEGSPATNGTDEMASLTPSTLRPAGPINEKKEECSRKEEAIKYRAAGAMTGTALAGLLSTRVGCATLAAGLGLVFPPAAVIGTGTCLLTGLGSVGGAAWLSYKAARDKGACNILATMHGDYAPLSGCHDPCLVSTAAKKAGPLNPLCPGMPHQQSFCELPGASGCCAENGEWTAKCVDTAKRAGDILGVHCIARLADGESCPDICQIRPGGMPLACISSDIAKASTFCSSLRNEVCCEATGFWDHDCIAQATKELRLSCSTP